MTAASSFQPGPVLVVDDDDEARARIAAALAPRGYSIAEARTGEEALLLVQEEAPGLAILDICLPGISGYQVCHSLRQQFGEGLPIVFLSGARTESYDRVAGLLVGGDEYLTKPIAPDELLIRVDRLIRRTSPVMPSVAVRLTPREREVLALLADGLNAREIAARLFLSPKTVESHCENILRKLGVRTRAQAVALAFRDAEVGTRR
jgi:DNA-binding NarL/FixJ family response regulator